MLPQATDDSWSDFVDALLSDDDGLVAVLRLYGDASNRKETGLFSVGGYLIESGRARRFRQEWKSVFGEQKFSWADLVAKSEPFQGISKPEHDQLIRAGVKLVRENFIAGVIVSCWTQDVENFSPRWIRGYGRAYSICCHFCATGMGQWAKENGYKGGIAYIFETGDDYNEEAHHVLNQATKVDVVQQSYQYFSHGFAPKDAGSPFHGPDLLAWEWGKYWTESVAQQKRQKRPMRLSLVALLRERLDRYRFIHLGGDKFLAFLNQVRDFGIEQLQEDAAVAESVSSSELGAAVETSEQTTPVGDPD